MRDLTRPAGTLTTLNVVQRSDEWYAARAGMMTASAVGGLLTPSLAVADNATSRGLVAAIAAERITGFTDPTWTSVDMQRGVDEEVYAVDVYAEHRAPVTECGFMVRSWPDGIELGYSPDGLVGDDGLIEIKSRRGKKHVETVLSGIVPPENMGQLQAGLLVSGRDWIDYVSYCAGMALWVIRVEPDPRWVDALHAALTAFEVAVLHTVETYADLVADCPMTDRPIMEMVI